MPWCRQACRISLQFERYAIRSRRDAGRAHADQVWWFRPPRARKLIAGSLSEVSADTHAATRNGGHVDGQASASRETATRKRNHEPNAKRHVDRRDRRLA